MTQFCEFREPGIGIWFLILNYKQSSKIGACTSYFPYSHLLSQILLRITVKFQDFEISSISFSVYLHLLHSNHSKYHNKCKVNKTFPTWLRSLRITVLRRNIQDFLNTIQDLNSNGPKIPGTRETTLLVHSTTIRNFLSKHNGYQFYIAFNSLRHVNGINITQV